MRMTSDGNVRDVEVGSPLSVAVDDAQRHDNDECLTDHQNAVHFFHGEEADVRMTYTVPFVLAVAKKSPSGEKSRLRIQPRSTS